MDRKSGSLARIMALALPLLLAGCVSGKSVAREAGIYVYLDAAGNALNVDRRGMPHPATALQMARARARTYFSYGAGGTPDAPGTGAICLMPEMIESCPGAGEASPLVAIR